MTLDPKAEYRARAATKRAELDRVMERIGLVSWLRLGTLLSSVGLVIVALTTSPYLLNFLYLPLLLFVVLLVLHGNLYSRKARCERNLEWYNEGLERMEDRWMGKGNQRVDLVEEDHPYALDLDIFGPNSLFELLCTARTQSGEETLASWLTTLPSREQIVARQKAVQELASDLLFRERLNLIGEELRGSIAPRELVSWALGAPLFPSPGALRFLSLASAALTLFAFFAWLLFSAPLALLPLPLLLVLLLRGITSRRVSTILTPLSRAARELAVLAQGLELLEGSPFKAAALRELQKAVVPHGRRPSEAIRALNRHVAWLDARRNQLFAPVAFFLLWELQFALQIERWRCTYGPKIQTWLSTVGALEATAALATYAFEHPNDPFPTILDEAGHLDAKGLGHPLSPEAGFVRNSLQLGARQLYVISGSNMSGKSTFLRTIGVNMVLAYAGAPVRAEALSISRFHLGSSLKVGDSLLSGVSKFYAEIHRLKIILSLSTQEEGFFFLIDEIFNGTNSHDRQQGAQALLLELVRRGGCGLITTHDLALTEISRESASSIENMHFTDSITDGKVQFDYRLRHGVVSKSNALELMRSVGLPV